MELKRIYGPPKELETRLFNKYFKQGGGVLEPLCDKCEETWKDKKAYFYWECQECKTPYAAVKYSIKKGNKIKTIFIYHYDSGRAINPTGSTQWKKIGKKYGYWKYFERYYERKFKKK